MEELKILAQKLNEWCESEDGKRYFENEKKKHEIKLGRFNKFKSWLDNNDFDTLIYRLILMHDDDYIEKCHNKGYEEKPNNVLEFIFDYVIEFGKQVKVKEFDCDFSNAIWEFKGYYFQIIWGQGAIQRIYNKEDMRMLLQL